MEVVGNVVVGNILLVHKVGRVSSAVRISVEAFKLEAAFLFFYGDFRSPRYRLAEVEIALNGFV